MLKVRDTFLHFLADNLDDYAVHPITRNPEDPSAEFLATNAVNVEFLGLDLSFDFNDQQVAIDIVADSDEDAVEMLQAVWDLLSSSFFTPLYDYTDPNAPYLCGKNVVWNSRHTVFRKVHSENYAHYSGLLTLQVTQS